MRLVLDPCLELFLDLLDALDLFDADLLDRLEERSDEAIRLLAASNLTIVAWILRSPKNLFVMSVNSRVLSEMSATIVPPLPHITLACTHLKTSTAVKHAITI